VAIKDRQGQAKDKTDTDFKIKGAWIRDDKTTADFAEGRGLGAKAFFV
jgi:hypothetical protein